MDNIIDLNRVDILSKDLQRRSTLCTYKYILSWHKCTVTQRSGICTLTSGDVSNGESFCAGDKLEPLYAPIRQKLGSALINWHPSDGSAKIILAPWVGVFRQGHMDAFLVKNVLPKLGQVIEEMPITPHQQNLGQWRSSF